MGARGVLGARARGRAQERWETDRGFYQIDRFGLGYDVEYRSSRHADDRWRVEPSNDHRAGQLEWKTAQDAMRACRLHYELLATMRPAQACAEIAAHPERVTNRRTLTGLPPVVVSPTVPTGAWQ